MESDLKYEKGDYARTHEEARKVVCCCCSRKAKKAKKHHPISVVDTRFSNLIKQYVYSEYSVDNVSHPTALCDTCRLVLVAFEKVSNFLNILAAIIHIIFQNPEKPGRNLPPLLDYSHITSPPPNTRSNEGLFCPCTVCELTRVNGSDYTKFVKNHQNKRGRPSEKIAQTEQNNLNLCTQGFSEIAQGKSHNCV